MEEVFNIPMQSAEIGELAKALSEFQGSIKQPKLNKSVTVKTKTGGSYNFQYADLGACIAAAAPELKKNGLAVIQTIQGQMLVTTLSHSSGQFINSTLPLNQQTLFSTEFQSIGSMITYLKRYAYCAILGIVADDDDDANAACCNQVKYNKNGQQTAEQQPQQSAGITGAILKNAIDGANEKQNAKELKEYWCKVYQKYPELQQNKKFNDALFQKASSLCIAELDGCKNEDEILLLIDRWNDIWGAVVTENTPAGNAIMEKLNSYRA